MGEKHLGLCFQCIINKRCETTQARQCFIYIGSCFEFAFECKYEFNQPLRKMQDINILLLHTKVLFEIKTDCLKFLERCASLDVDYKLAIYANIAIYILPYEFTKYSTNCHEDIIHF